MSFDLVLQHVAGAHHGHHGGHGHGTRRSHPVARRFALVDDRPYVEYLPDGYAVDVVPFTVLPDDALEPQTGAIERRNPLPVGKYWVDVFRKDLSAFEAWGRKNSVKLKVRTIEHFPNDDDALTRDWILFDVLAPVPWEGPGLPTIADASVTSSSDTADRPPPTPGAIDQMQGMLDQATHEIGDALRTGVIVSAAMATGFFVLSRMGKHR